LLQVKCPRIYVTHFASRAHAAPRYCAHNDNTRKDWRMLVISSLLCIVFVVWMGARIWKRDALLAILTVFLWPVSVFALMRYWGDERSDIKVPFLLFMPAFAYLLYA
jgi:hypothetical protein